MAKNPYIADILSTATCVLLDFDGPVCSVFAGLTAPAIAAEVVKLLRDHGHDIPAGATDTRDPLDLLEYSVDHCPHLVTEVEAYVAQRERDAVTVAAPTPGAADFLRAVHASGRLLAIVSNNAHRAVETYLHTRELSGYVDDVSARQPADAAHLKPDPRLLLRAADILTTPMGQCVLLGDSVTDVEAAHTIGIPAIGYANQPDTHRKLHQAGADVIVADMNELAANLRGQPDTGHA